MTTLFWARGRAPDILQHRALLTAAELARGQRRRHPEPHLAAQLLGRALLARLLDRPMAAIKLTRDDDGAPLCEGACISLSHSGDQVAAAVSLAPVGIDIEVPSGRSRAALAARLGWPQAHFYEHWCAAEACLKLWRLPVWAMADLRVEWRGRHRLLVSGPGPGPQAVWLHYDNGICCALAGSDQALALVPLAELF
ncbi:hypothetical protein [Gallaecimonas sp. GXIMD4217]|uniref:4'-phosphopantetheinyl transferase family protein n=1 Tax=Gallaecimonas sp. GXIMD4217 TaxID=3131927 RepID=UPI00311B41CB